MAASNTVSTNIQTMAKKAAVTAATSAIARVAQHVHDLVITEKYMNFSAGRSRLLLERHQEVQCFAYSGAAIGDVSCLNEDRTAAGPSLLSINQACRREDRHERLEAAVHIGHGDDSGGGLRRKRARGERYGNEDGNDQPHAT